MMENVKCIFLWLLFSGLLFALEGCDSRDVSDEYYGNDVRIALDWTERTDELPEMMRVIFYSKDIEGRRIEGYLPAEGGELKIPSGNYEMVIYNFLTESIQIRGDKSYDEIEAFTGRSTGMNTNEEMVWSPDPLYVVALDDVKVEESDVTLQMNLKPEIVVVNYSFDIPVDGWDRVSYVVCKVSGLKGSYFLGKRVGTMSEVPIYVDMEYKNGVLHGDFSGFEAPVHTKSLVDVPVKLTLKLVKRDNTQQQVEVDITDLIGTSPEGGAEVESEIQIEVPIPGGEIVVDELEPGTGGTGGGIGGEVNDWGDETNVDFPVI